MSKKEKTTGKSKAPKVRVPPSKIEEHLLEQLRLLKKSAAEFDAGDAGEFRRMAVAVRVLVHDTTASHSLVKQVGLAEMQVGSAAVPINAANLLPEFSLAMMEMSGAGARLVPTLGDGPRAPREIPLSDWWVEPVLRDRHHHHFTRRDIVLAVANQDGGAHVDPEIDEAYHRLANEHSIGFVSIGPDGEKPLEHIEKVYLRQITWELVRSLEKAWGKVVGNRPCHCGSGRKFRYCHGKM
jgi:hypothetical protein